MEQKNGKIKELIDIKKVIDNKQKLKIEDETFKKIMFIYTSGIKELTNKLEILKDEYKIFKNYNLIDHIDIRIKRPESIINKMEKRKLELDYYNMIENINDIAGIRIICPLKKDIFTIKKIIEQMEEIKVLKEKDYITTPKKSGYSSYHLIVEIPVILLEKTIFVKIEIQIRTIAMDFWANLEHKIKYKPEKNSNKKDYLWNPITINIEKVSII